MEGKVFTLDIIRDWSFLSATPKTRKNNDNSSTASIKRLAAHYYKKGKAKTMDEAMSMAAGILR